MAGAAMAAYPIVSAIAFSAGFRSPLWVGQFAAFFLRMKSVYCFTVGIVFRIENSNDGISSSFYFREILFYY
jgi:hypothetical protein